MSQEHKADRLDQEQRQRAALVNLARAVFVVLLAVVTALGILTVSAEDDKVGSEFVRFAWLAIIAVLLFAGCVVGIDLLTPRRKLTMISAILFGSFAGIIVAVAFGILIDLIAKTWGFADDYDRYALTVKLIVGLGLCYIGVTTVLQTQDDIRLVIPYVEFTKTYRGTKPMLVDTSCLIDGRLLDIAEVGFLQAPLVIAQDVIDELQTLSDSGDRLKRARGRRGLDLLSRLQRSTMLDVSISDATTAAGRGVDQILVELAQQMPAGIITTDAGLARVAAVHDIPVLNVNDLANAMKPQVIPGQELSVEVIRVGEQPGQGVAYLDDGTMVVIENGADAVGRQVSVDVVSAMQTSAGRLIFGRIPGAPGAPSPPNGPGNGSDPAQPAGASLRPEHEQQEEPPPLSSAELPPSTPAEERTSTRRSPSGPRPGASSRNPRRS
ncbi:MAG: TRAM domain-containing protein [Planctomycetota bacterium]